jgi:chaperone protein DnaK
VLLVGQAASIAIGIDLGTTFSCVGVYKGGQVEIIPNDQGNRITPSWVAFTDQGERLVGDAAKNQAAGNPNNTVYDAKRLIGRLFDEQQVQDDIPMFPFDVISVAGKPSIRVHRKDEELIMPPEEVSAMVLERLKKYAEDFIGEEVTDAVVTVPAYFNDAQRQATKDAGRIAGLNVMRVLNEPTAAAIAFGLDRKIRAKKVLVFDLGGGTFDVSLLKIDKGEFRVLATSGDTHLGGADFDQRIMDHFMKRMLLKEEVDIRHNKRALAKLRREAEAAKRKLSSEKSVRIEIPSIAVDKYGESVDFKDKLSRAKFEELNKDLFKKCAAPIKTVLDDTDTRPSEVDSVVLVGGSTRIPYIRKLVSLIFKDNEPATGVNPDEAVAYGAAIQAAVLTGAISPKKVALFDVTPLSMGIKTAGGTMSNLITRNTPVPTSKEQVFTTFKDNQRKVKIEIYEGERALVKHNHYLGKFQLTDIPPGPRGSQKFRVTFTISDEGILTVSAFHVGHGSNEVNLTISGESGRLTEDDIKNMLDMAEQHKDQDKAVRANLAAKASLEGYTFSLKNWVQDERLTDEEGPGKDIYEVAEVKAEGEESGASLMEEVEKLIEAIDETAAYVLEFPDETMETYGARRSELQEIAAPVTKALQEVFDQIEAAIEAEKNPPPEEEGEEDEEDEDGPGGRDEDEL